MFNLIWGPRPSLPSPQLLPIWVQHLYSADHLHKHEHGLPWPPSACRLQLHFLHAHDYASAAIFVQLLWKEKANAAHQVSGRAHLLMHTEGGGKFGLPLLVLTCVVCVEPEPSRVTCSHSASSTPATGRLPQLKQLITPNSCFLYCTNPPHLALRPAHTARRPGSQTRARIEVGARSLLLP